MQPFVKNAFLSCVFLASAFFSSTAVAGAAPADDASGLQLTEVRVQINDELVAFPESVPYVDEQNSLQVPLRFMSDKLGYHVDWQKLGSKILVTLNNNERKIILTTGEEQATVNGKPVSLESAPQLHGGKTFVPLRFLTESSEIRLQWDELNRIAILDEDGEYHAPAWYAPDLDKAEQPIPFKATAYSSSADENGGWAGLDYFGNPLQLGTIAVDPNVIPLGSTVFITGYQFKGLPAGGMMAKAADIGGAVKGKHIDIFIPGPAGKSLDFGSQQVKLYRMQE